MVVGVRRLHWRLLAVASVLLLSACTALPWVGVPSGQVTGTVLTGPTCPVERVGFECPPRPVSGAAVVAFDGDTMRGSTLTDADGAFRVTLPFGRYVIKATNAGGYASTATQEVVVSESPVHIRLIVDSGIR
ncbi:carboxypeptidase-like regulatory domain-containing protein [bacterium RCC_150]